MEVLECIKARRSVRKYLKKEVPWDHIASIIDAGRYAPSSGNLQNWKFIVVLDEGKRNSVSEACFHQSWMADAPVMIVVVAEFEKAEEYYKERGKVLYSAQNCAAAAQNMLLEATNLGLSSCWVSAFHPDSIKKIFGMPKGVEPQIILTIGYSDAKPDKPMKWPLENVLYFNGWRSKLKDPITYMRHYSVHTGAAVNKGKKAVQSAGKTVSEKAKEIIDKVHKKLTEEKKSQSEDIKQ